MSIAILLPKVENVYNSACTIILVSHGQTPPLFDIWTVERSSHHPNIKKGRSLAARD